MSDLLIKDIDDDLRQKLETLAKRHGRTIDAEARALLKTATNGQGAPEQENIVAVAQRLFGATYGFDLDLPPRGQAPVREPPNFLE